MTPYYFLEQYKIPILEHHTNKKMTDNQTKKNKTSKKNSLSQVTIAFICTFISDEINELKTSLKAEKKTQLR